MAPWFERLIKGVLWQSIRDLVGKLEAEAEAAVEKKLRSLKAGDKLSDSPLITVLSVNNAQDTLTLLLRGRFPLYPGAVSAFMRIELVLLRDVNFFSGDVITIKQWVTVMGDIQAGKDPVFDVNVAFGYDKGSFSGRGALKLTPPVGLGFDLFLGGLNDRGMMIGVDVQSPVALPLGPTGLGLIAVGGDYAYNFIPRIEKNGVIIPEPTAMDYVTWGRDVEKIDRWVAGPIDQTAVGLGVRIGLVTIVDNGWVFMLNPVGVGVFSLGPTFVLGGAGRLLKMKNAKVGGLFALDIPSQSLALGLNADLEIKVADFAGFLEVITLMKVHGVMDAFFSFKDPSAWYINLGSEADPLKVSVFEEVPVFKLTIGQSAEGFFQVNNERILFGAAVSLGGELDLLGIFKIIARLSIKLVAFIGWNPFLVKGRLALLGELGVKIWKFQFLLTGKAEVSAYLPKPFMVKAELSIKVDLPWPIPDPDEAKLPIKIGGDNEPIAPVLSPPIQVGQATNGDGAQVILDQKMGAQHAISGRNWNLDQDTTWPDLEIMVPFQRRVTDKSGTVIGPVISPEIEGGYTVHHDLTRVELFDLVRNQVVPGVKGVWANGPDGESARLHLLGIDPVSWLLASVKNNQVVINHTGRVFEQNFDYGPPETFQQARIFGRMVVHPTHPDQPMQLRTEFQPMLPTRLLEGESFILTFQDANGVSLAVDQVTFSLFGLHPRAWITVNGKDYHPKATGKKLFGSVYLMSVTLDLGQPEDKVEVQVSRELPLLFYTVTYRTAPTYSTLQQSKTTLKPGRYRLTIEGSSNASHAGDSDYKEAFPDSSPVSWRAVQEFKVDYPETLRPYIHSTTLGDNRLFGEQAEQSTWNPTPYGAGFPAYRGYLGGVRFLASYISKMFPGAPEPFLRMRLVNEELTPRVVATAAPPVTDNPFGESSLSSAGQAWIKAGGGSIPPDEELIFNKPLPPSGKTTLQLLLVHPTGGEIPLDQWTLILSRFTDFKAHMTWNSGCITVFYTAGGVVQATAVCRPIVPGDLTLGNAHASFLERYRPILAEFRQFPANRIEHSLARDLLDMLGVVDPTRPYPPELNNPPADWTLPASLTQHLSKPSPAGKNRFTAETGLRFNRFAEASGVRLGTNLAESLTNAVRRPEATTVEALLDPQGRPYALWLRTPEPVDWRRVEASLRIEHVTPENGCPTGLAHRHPLALEVSILPNPDGSSAFLVGYLNGVATRLPRGQYRLALTFKPDVSGLVRLRPGPAAGTAPEVIKLVFIQPSGLDWPTAETKIHIPQGVIDAIFKHLFPPDLWGPVARGEISAHDLEQLLTQQSGKLANAGRLFSGPVPDDELNLFPGELRLSEPVIFELPTDPGEGQAPMELPGDEEVIQASELEITGPDGSAVEMPDESPPEMDLFSSTGMEKSEGDK